MLRAARSGLACLVATLACCAALGLSLPLTVHSAPVLATYVDAHARGQMLPADFLNYYTAGRTLLVAPGQLYLPDQEADRQRTITGHIDTYAQFQNMPQVALLFVPLALLPYGLAYLAWAALNACLLGLCARLLAPRLGRLGWLLWLALILTCWAPAQLALVDGQTSILVLFGFCVWTALLERNRAQSAAGPNAAWLLTWAWKPPLLPGLLLGLSFGGALRAALLLGAAQVLMLTLAVTWAGPEIVLRYVNLTTNAAYVAGAGQTVFGIAGTSGLDGLAADTLAGGLALLVVAAIVALWWGGLRTDRRRLLQLAALPLAAVLLAPRALGYELTLWLASGWLVLRYVTDARDARTSLLPLLSLVWLASVVTILSEGQGFAWAALAGLALLGGLVGELRRPGVLPNTGMNMRRLAILRYAPDTAR